MRTMKISIKQHKNAALYEYFCMNTADAKCMYNTANFYIRNTMTGIQKSPEERTKLETEVLHDVFTSIQKANIDCKIRHDKKIAKCGKTGGMKNAVCVWNILKKGDAPFKYPTRNEWFLSYTTLDSVFKYSENPVYTRMNSQVNQNAIKKLVEAWKGYFKALKDYASNPSKYTGKPKIPKYLKSERYVATFTNQTARLKNHGDMFSLQFVHHSETLAIGKLSGYHGFKYLKTEVKPVYGAYVLLISFDDKPKEVVCPENPSRFVGIDVGVNNLFSVGNNFGAPPFLIKGGAAKSVNQNFNKQKAKLMSALTKGSDSTVSIKQSKRLSALSRNRDNFFRDFFYKCAWKICRFAVENQADVIVLGHNKLQKQNINMGKENNQSFVSIPYYKFQQILISVAHKCDLFVVVREESYTSKASLLDMDEIPTYRKNDKEYVFSGERVSRGLYRSKNGILMNADINGACNIIRKEFPHAFDNQNLEYLYKKTEVIKYTDLYKNAKSVCSSKFNGKKHKPSPSSIARHKKNVFDALRLRLAKPLDMTKDGCEQTTYKVA